MTVNSETSSTTAFGNGSTTLFPFEFRVLDADHLVVQARDPDTDAITHTYTADEYVLTGLGNSTGTVTFDTAPASGVKIVITRSVPYTQELDIVNSGGFYPETVEDQLDLMVMQTQQVVRQVENLDTVGGALAEALALSTGAGLVNYKDATITGTVARSVQAKLRDRVHVKDFGAVGDGTTDDSAALVLAFASGQALDFSGGVFYVNTSISVPAGSHSWIGDGKAEIKFGANGRLRFLDNNTEWHVDALVFRSYSTLTCIDIQGTGGIFLNLEQSKFISDNTSTALIYMGIEGAYGSVSSCEFSMGTGQQDAVYITASTANLDFIDCVSWGYQSRSFMYMNGNDTAFGVQGVRLVGCSLVDRQNGIIMEAGAGACFGLQIVGCMIDSMDNPIRATGVGQLLISGCYIGGNDATESPIILTNCTGVNIVGCQGESYGANFIASPRPPCITLSGGSLINVTSCHFILTGPGATLLSVAGGTTLYGVTDTEGTHNFIMTDPDQFAGGSYVATCGWVAKNGRVFFDSNAKTASAALAITDCGRYNVFNAAGPVTATLPSCAAATAYRASLYIVNWSSGGDVTLAAQAGENVRTTDLTLGWNEFIELINDPGSSSWIPVNRGVMG